jgi:hypothetical protein
MRQPARSWPARSWLVASLCFAFAGAPALLAGDESEPKSFTFRAPPVNSLGVKSLADLRGKPVLIDFWGTR